MRHFIVRNEADWNFVMEQIRALSADEEKMITLSESFSVTAPMKMENASNVTVIGADKCTISGGIEKTVSFQKGKLLKIPLREEPRMLMIDGKIIERSVYPQNGLLEHLSNTDLKWLNSRNGGWGRALYPEEVDHLLLDKKDIPLEMDIENADLRVIHVWDESTVAVKFFDWENGRVDFCSSMAHPGGAFDRHDYQILNTGFALQPNHWYYDRKERFIGFLPGEDGHAVTVKIPQSRGILAFVHCKAVTVKNISFCLSNAEAGCISGLRGIYPCGAIQAEDSEKIRLEKLLISYCAGNGVKLLRSENTVVEDCRVEQCGTGGIFTYECENEKILNNTVYNIGLLDFSAISIHAGGKSVLPFVLEGSKEEHGTTEIIDNKIEYAPYCGITASGGPHLIAGNKILRCMQRLNDGGAIYCSRGNHTVIKNNWVSDLPATNASAFYYDELSHDCVVEGNVSINVKKALQNHLAENNIVRDNIFYSDGDLLLSLSRSLHYRWERNVFFAKGRITFGCYSDYNQTEYPPEECLDFNDDVAFSAENDIRYGANPLPWEKWGLKTEKLSMRIDKYRILCENEISMHNPYFIKK